jgi:hypothetical protein
MLYEVASLTVTANDQCRWTPLGSKIRRKADAIALADAQPIRTTVTLYGVGGTVHDNGKPHGGKPAYLRRCPCPLCVR